MKKWGVVTALLVSSVVIVGGAAAQHHGGGHATLLIQPEFAHPGQTLVFSLDTGGGGGMGMGGDEFALYGAVARGRTPIPGGMMGTLSLDLGSPRLIARGTFDRLGHATATAALPSGSIQPGRVIYFQFVTIEDMMGRDIPMMSSNVDTVTIIR